jgi:hypothetical protein
MNIKLKKFDIEHMSDDCVIAMLGKRRSGKSQLMKDIMYRKQHMPVGTVISPTEPSNEFFCDFIPPIFIHEDYHPNIVDRFVTRQRNMVAKMKSEYNQTGGSSIDPRGFLILDDCLYNNSWTREKSMRYIFQNGRHAKILFIFSMQYPMGVTPDMRTNIDYAFIFRENNVKNRQRIYENYAGVFPTFDIFCQVLDQCTENYECLVIDNTSRSNKLEDNVFWYKAEFPLPSFKLGRPEFWAAGNGKAHYDEEGEESFDPSMVKAKGRQFNIRVKKTD